jgi:hypothetical protein
MSNVIDIEFLSKKGWPEGPWLHEPDVCAWEHKLPCLAIRDMSLGIWRGFVGLSEGHPFYGKIIEDLVRMPQATELFLSTYGGLNQCGRLAPEHNNFGPQYWWIGLATIGGGDLVPLLQPDEGTAAAKVLAHQTYKGFSFVRKEVNKLANSLVKIS